MGLGRHFALIGGLAVSARAEPGMTRDIDLAVAVTSDSDAEELVRAIRSKEYGLIGTLEQTATGRLASARFGVDRGYGRGRNLPVLLDEAIALFSPR